MHSFLLLEIDKKLQEKKKDTLLKKFEISMFDQISLASEKTIGIEEIRTLQKKLIFAPVHSKTKAAIVHNADTMTPDAQNAFLKTLEEPPANTIIILLAQNKEKFLPTVLSRCSLLYDTFSAKPVLENQPDTKTSFYMLSLSEKLRLAQEKSKTKELALIWLENEILKLRNQMISLYDLPQCRLIRLLQETHKTLSQTNANTRLMLEHVLLSV